MNLGDTVLAAESTKKAYDLRGHVSERERLYIESHYLENVLGNLEKASRVYELWEQTYPDDVVPPANLGGIYTQLGQYGRALAEDLRAFRIDPSNASNYADRVGDYIYLNRLQEAEATAEQAISGNFDSPKLHTRIYVLAFLRNDSFGMAKQIAWSSAKPGVEDVFLALEAETAASRGRFTTAHELYRRAVKSAQTAGDKETAARYEVSSALQNSLVGQPIQARESVAAALRLSTGRDVQAAAALTLAFIAETVQSQKLADDLAKRFPEDTIVQFNYLPTIRAQIALDSRSPENAIATTEQAAMYELGDPGDGPVTPAMYPIYVRGQAYLAAGDGNKAASEFQRLLDNPGVVQIRIIGALAHLGIARAYKLQGDIAKAREAYKDFLTRWIDADQGMAVMKHARSEFAKL
jgi:tetratricopeptide (TPR) repeat protein